MTAAWQWSMPEAHVRALLAVAMSYDNRRPGEANLMAWAEAAERGRWTFESAREAIHAHYARSTEFLMPAHITAALRAQRSAPPVFEAPLIEGAGPADPERVRSIVAEVSSRLGWVAADLSGPERAALRVDCPWCHARAGSPCTRHITRGPHRGEWAARSAPHPSRVETARTATETQEQA